MLSSSDNTASRVLGKLRDDIVSGHYAPAEKLRMADLKARYGSGVGPLREALSYLIAEQLVVVENQRGYRVQAVSPAELKDIYTTRAHIEALCVGLALDRGDDQWEAEVVAAAHRLGKLGTPDKQQLSDLQQWEDRHHAFHTAIAKGCGSAELLRVRESLYAKAARYRNLWLRENATQAAAFDANQQEHMALKQAALQHDRDQATELVFRHLMVPVTMLSESISLQAVQAV